MQHYFQPNYSMFRQLIKWDVIKADLQHFNYILTRILNSHDIR